MKPYELIEHTADVKVRAMGKTLEEAFSNAVTGTFEVMTDTSRIAEKKHKKIVLESHDLQALLYDFIDELIYYLDTEGFLAKRAQKLKIAKKEKGCELRCEIVGDTADDYKKYDVTAYVKSMTYNDMKIYEKHSYHIVEFVLDI